jgi:hypothetical protein
MLELLTAVKMVALLGYLMGSRMVAMKAEKMVVKKVA